MIKYILAIVMSVFVVLLLLTIFGPWATYITHSNDGNMLGRTVYFSDYPVWLGEMIPRTISQQEDDKLYLAYLNQQIERYDGRQGAEAYIEIIKSQRDRHVENMKLHN